jgi:hypothetical protein
VALSPQIEFVEADDDAIPTTLRPGLIPKSGDSECSVG